MIASPGIAEALIGHSSAITRRYTRLSVAVPPLIAKVEPRLQGIVDRIAPDQWPMLAYRLNEWAAELNANAPQEGGTDHEPVPEVARVVQPEPR